MCFVILKTTITNILFFPISSRIMNSWQLILTILAVFTVSALAAGVSLFKGLNA